jgi:hypothetical protein
MHSQDDAVPTSRSGTSYIIEAIVGHRKDGKASAFGRIDRSLLGMRHSQINPKLKEQGLSELSSFAISLSKVVQLHWTVRDRSCRQVDVEMGEELSDSEASEHS